MNLAEPRTAYAVEVLGDMFPGRDVATEPARDGNPRRTFALAPTGGRPRLLVPTAPRAAAGAALRTYGGRLTRGARVSYALAAGALATAGPALLRARLSVADEPAASPAIDDHLAAALGRDVAVAVHLTPTRANRKPVVQALAAGERHPIAFAKLAVNPLTEHLVDREAEALQRLAEHAVSRLVVPEVAYHGRFAGNALLAQRPLPTWLPGKAPTLAETAVAANEVAAIGGAQRTPLAGSSYWSDLQRRAAALAPSPAADRLRTCIERLAATVGGRDTAFTASHGDWSPWNMWLTARGLLVWDWERFETETPAGFDLLHFRLNDQFIRGGRTSAGVAEQLVADAAEVLRYSHVDAPPLHTVLLYLVHLGVRYETDGQAAAGSRLGRLDTWLLPVVEAGLSDPTLTKQG